MDTFPKDPNDTLDYKVDWSRWLEGDSDTIATSSWVVPSGITEVSATYSTTVATIEVSGGTAGQTYTITNRITTAGGRQKDWSFRLRILQR